jgi:hypothetical protein
MVYFLFDEVIDLDFDDFHHQGFFTRRDVCEVRLADAAWTDCAGVRLRLKVHGNALHSSKSNLSVVIVSGFPHQMRYSLPSHHASIH